jgi:hypothetical protein
VELWRFGLGRKDFLGESPDLGGGSRAGREPKPQNNKGLREGRDPQLLCKCRFSEVL